MRNTLTLIFTAKRLQCLALLLILAVVPVCNTMAGVTKAKAGFQQEKIDITGTVKDGQTGQPLPGVTILVKGTSNGTISDLEGRYTLKASPEDILVFSFIGYLTEEVTVGTNTTLDLAMSEDIIGLNEVVVTGYGVIKKSDLTGAVASVSGDRLTEMPAASVDQALQGRAAGVSITQATGMPGGSVNIQIRGISSINGTQPLVIVDGVQASLNDLNPGDIQSIEILKDASSAAIYGSTGGNGVILVTTKKGQTGKLTTNFNYYRGYQSPWKKMEMCNTEELMDINNYISLLRTGDYYNDRVDTLKNYDWQDIMFRNALMENYDINFSGGNEKSSYYFSVNYLKQEGILENSDYERMSFRINSDHKLSKIFKVGENVSFTRTKNVGYDENVFQNEFNSPIGNILRYYPYYGDYDANGDWVVSTLLNPRVAPDIMDLTRQNYSTGGNVYLDITPFKGFTYTSKVNAYTNFSIRDRFWPTYYYNQNNSLAINQVDKSVGQQWGWEAQNYANYYLTVAGVHNFNAMAGVEARLTQSGDISGTRYGLINETPEMQYLSASLNDSSTGYQLVAGEGWKETSVGFFGRLNYDYKGKYLISVNVRNDQSSKFGPAFRSGTFPSASVGWKFSEEEFVKNLGIFSFGKLRFGYGTTGANAPERYKYYNRVTTTEAAYNYPFGPDNQTSQGANLVSAPNPEMHWETQVMKNLGLDLGFLQNKLNLSVDYFSKKSIDMLGYKSMPGVSGFYQYSGHADPLGGDARPYVNFGTMVNSGVEITLGYKKMEGDLKAAFDLNMTFLKNKVVELPSDSLIRGSAGVNLKNMCLTKEGSPVSQFNVYETDGLYTWDDARILANGKPFIVTQPYYIRDDGDTAWFDKQLAPGDIKIVDRNEDGVIDDSDRKIKGSPIPKLVLGFSANLEYKNFDLNVFFEGKFGHQLFNGSKIALMDQDPGVNKLKIALDQYREPIYAEDGTTLLMEGNTDATLPRYRATNFSYATDFYVENGSYLRLKNVQLGYTLPSKISSKVGIDKLRLYIGAKNLLTFTKYTGFDPEISTGNVLAQGIDPIGYYPQSRTYLFGCNIQF